MGLAVRYGSLQTQQKIYSSPRPRLLVLELTIMLKGTLSRKCIDRMPVLVFRKLAGLISVLLDVRLTLFV